MRQRLFPYAAATRGEARRGDAGRRKAAGKRAGRVAVLADEGWRKRTAADRTGQGEDPLDLWLRRSLHKAFDPALEEPVPGDILRLIEEDRAERERLRRRRAAERSG